MILYSCGPNPPGYGPVPGRREKKIIESIFFIIKDLVSKIMRFTVVDLQEKNSIINN